MCYLWTTSDWIDAATRKSWSAMAVADTVSTPIEHEDLVWIGIDILWQRWFPERPSFEIIDEFMQAGYAEKDEAKTFTIWRETWSKIGHVMQQAGHRSLEQFHTDFGGTQSVHHWVQDYDELMCRASWIDSSVAHFRIELNEALIADPKSCDLTIENARRALAESLYVLSYLEKADALYEQWLADDPAWGWGWIGWSDSRFVFRPEAISEDVPEAIAILKRALQIPNLRDRSDVLDRLIQVCDDSGQPEMAEPYRDRAAQETAKTKQTSRQSKSSLPSESSGFQAASTMPNSSRTESQSSFVPETRQKVGRNEPCPCRSGRKFKKCCG